MTQFTLDDLKRIMRTSVGVDESVDLEGAITQVPFNDLGYDSLAVLEIAGTIQKELSLSLPDEAVAELKTPGEFVGYVNERLSAVAR